MLVFKSNLVYIPVHDEWQVRRRHTATPTHQQGCQLMQRYDCLERWQMTQRRQRCRRCNLHTKVSWNSMTSDNASVDLNKFVDSVSGATTSESYISLISWWCEAAQHDKGIWTRLVRVNWSSTSGRPETRGVPGERIDWKSQSKVLIGTISWILFES